MVDILGIDGTAGLVVSLTLAILLAVAPLLLAHALYQVAGALRLQAFLSKPAGIQWDPRWSEQSKATPMPIILVVVGLAILIIVTVVAVATM